ncbi:hypothetical protein, partial [Fournierella sp.]|uniref:hypothetical protein n=1 Tax=Allofournierella sp. TaxID=1940256 RepID=UPI0030792368
LLSHILSAFGSRGIMERLHSLRYLSTLKQSKLFTGFPKLDQLRSVEEAKECLNRYFEDNFAEAFYEFAQNLIAAINLIPCA